MPYASINGVVGYQQVAFFGLPDTTERQGPGFMETFIDPYWGALEGVYVRANGSIRQGGLVVLTPAVTSGRYRWEATEVPNTANLGRPLYVAMTAMTSGQYGWVAQSGLVPVNCTASVAADTAFGIVAAGQGGAIANGKQVVGSRVMAPATTTVAKSNCVANSGSTRLQIPNADGWFCGIYLSGTGIAASTTVTDISPDGTQVTLSLATTAAVAGTVTGTYNNATVYYNVAHINRPFAQGQVV